MYLRMSVQYVFCYSTNIYPGVYQPTYLPAVYLCVSQCPVSLHDFKNGLDDHGVSMVYSSEARFHSILLWI